jgi:hypothetical protein
MAHGAREKWDVCLVALCTPSPVSLRAARRLRTCPRQWHQGRNCRLLETLVGDGGFREGMTLRRVYEEMKERKGRT